jgi:hypothetical protein
MISNYLRNSCHADGSMVFISFPGQAMKERLPDDPRDRAIATAVRRFVLHSGHPCFYHMKNETPCIYM